MPVQDEDLAVGKCFKTVSADRVDQIWKIEALDEHRVDVSLREGDGWIAPVFTQRSAFLSDAIEEVQCPG